MIRRLALVLSVLICGSDRGGAADLPTGSAQSRKVSLSNITGRVAVVDGRTLWFADRRILVTLNGIDSCDLPQWAFDPGPNDNSSFLRPIPCGALAKAWLKRSIGHRAVTCQLVTSPGSIAASGICQAGNMDLAHEMLRVGLARLTTAFRSNPRYFATQRRAVGARYGMWATLCPRHGGVAPKGGGQDARSQAIGRHQSACRAPKRDHASVRRCAPSTNPP